MDAIVRLQPKSTYATVSAALTLARGRRVALVFPVGERTCLGDMTSLERLRTRSHLLGKVAVIIGGDAWLRAHAVAAGFEAATTLEDWGETAPEHLATQPHSSATNPPRLWVVAPLANTGGSSGEADTWVSEPPDYVVALRESFASRSTAVRPPVLSQALATTMPADEPDDGATNASERFEEMVIGRILETSGLYRLQIPGAL